MRPLISHTCRGRWYRPLYCNNLTHFWDKVDIVYVMHFSDVTLLFEQWIIFKNLQFILLFLNIWTLTCHCLRLKNASPAGSAPAFDFHIDWFDWFEHVKELQSLSFFCPCLRHDDFHFHLSIWTPDNVYNRII